MVTTPTTGQSARTALGTTAAERGAGPRTPWAAERTLREPVREAVEAILDERQVLASGPEDEARVRAVITQQVQAYQRKAVTLNWPLLPDPAASVQRLRDEVLGFGLLQPLMDDPNIEEITCNGPMRIYVYEGGRKRLLQGEGSYFDSADDLLALMKKMVGQAGGRLDAAAPHADARLPDGSRLAAVIPPLAVDGPSLTIRKFLLRAQSLEDLVELGTLPEDAARFLDAAVRAGANILISGSTGSGKTTFLNALGASLATINERVITIEETAELMLFQLLPDCIALQARADNIEGRGEVTIRELVRTSLRMRPTRIVVGEVRGAEALDMLRAMSTGHEGSMGTLHANSAREALGELATLAMMTGERVPRTALDEMISRTIDLVVQIRLESQTARRRVVEIFEVGPLEGLTISGNTLWELGPGGEKLDWTGIQPRLIRRIAAKGIAYSMPRFGAARP